MVTNFRLKIIFCIVGFSWCSLALRAQDNPAYQMPPKSIADLVLAPLTPAVNIDSKGEWMLLLDRAPLPDIAELAEPELRIAGLRINPATNGPSRAGYYTAIRLRKVAEKNATDIRGLPENPRIGNIQWSPDEKMVAFTLTNDDGIDLWVASVTDATARKIAGIRLNAAYGNPFDWFSDSKTLLVKTIPAQRGKAPAQDRTPAGPVVQENLGKKAPARTFQDLLKNPYDEALFEYHCTTQLVLAGTDGKIRAIGQPGVVASASPSPDGRYIMTRTTHRPYSYLVPAGRFPTKIEVLDREGKPVATLADLPLADNIPIGFDAVPAGPRGHAWRPDQPATVYWTEAQDGGDPRREAAIRDKVFQLNAPFDGKPAELYASQYRFGSIQWGDDQLALAEESWWATRKSVTRLFRPGAPQTSPTVLFERSSEDKYSDPGDAQRHKNQYGRMVLNITRDRELILFGQGASPEGDRPFVDLLQPDTKKTKRLWRSEAPHYETPVAVLDAGRQLIVTSRESPSENPNYYQRDLKKGTLTPITAFAHPYPQLKDVKKQVLRYKRADGVDLTADLYLPSGYKKEDGPLPTLMWAYPVEFKNKDAAGQVSGSPYRFTRINWGSPVYWITQGYAVLDNASIPIVGEGDKEPNDTYVTQLVNSAAAAIGEGVRLGVVDSSRVGVGGHSYGAFMTANLLTHSKLFRAGIARSGAYNRTLTPFGFQSEERTYWQAPEVYNQMSPFMNADKMKTPLLLIHGEADNNAGTFPLQSERYYNALKGLGATVRFVLLPHESHGYAARQSILHMLWEMDTWLNKYVKNKGKA